MNWLNLDIDKGEAAARGAQIKNILGIKDDGTITCEQLKYVKENCDYLTEEENGLQTFMDSITDFDSAADWLSRNAYSLGSALNLLDYDFLKLPHGIKGL